ncbi:PfkB domain protein [Candidatus Vecturithrix granuli]|uniref:PfkB domain protein n=1 Tax=Vecturithrix granuli TaxID=1499967 RepID=A0A081BYI8_VECG1|nr:PfkB domain protein [Candidatus Vecturithrix granuli]
MYPYVTVIGGVNLDIKGCPLGQLTAATSNSGKVHTSAGGVGRNIAHNLALLGVPVYLLAAVGNDSFGAQILAETREAGVQVDYMQVIAGQQTGIYLAVLDHVHDLSVAIADMDVTASINQDYLEQQRGLIQQSRVVVLETNLSTEALRTAIKLCRQAQIPYLIEPVSVEKARKIHAISGNVDTITPNTSELEALSGRKFATMESLPAVCAELQGRFRHLLVTLGAQGVYHYDASAQCGQHYAAFPTRVLDANGAGDAFVAGFVSGIFHEYQIDRCIRLGMAAAHFTLQSIDTVNNELTFERCLTLI